MHLCLDHVDASGAQGFHTVIDVHHAFTFSHVQHDVQNDVAACPPRPHAGGRHNTLVMVQSRAAHLLRSYNHTTMATSGKTRRKGGVCGQALYLWFSK